MEIIYDNLERVLEDRPRFPITNFANGILKDAGEQPDEEREQKDEKKLARRAEEEEDKKEQLNKKQKREEAESESEDEPSSGDEKEQKRKRKQEATEVRLEVQGKKLGSTAKTSGENEKEEIQIVELAPEAAEGQQEAAAEEGSKDASRKGSEAVEKKSETNE